MSEAERSWQLAQAQTIIDLFTAAHGRPPDTKDETRSGTYGKKFPKKGNNSPTYIKRAPRARARSPEAMRLKPFPLSKFHTN